MNTRHRRPSRRRPPTANRPPPFPLAIRWGAPVEDDGTTTFLFRFSQENVRVTPILDGVGLENVTLTGFIEALWATISATEMIAQPGDGGGTDLFLRFPQVLEAGSIWQVRIPSNIVGIQAYNGGLLSGAYNASDAAGEPTAGFIEVNNLQPGPWIGA